MKTLLQFTDGTFEDLCAHLLPPNSWREEGAFLFAKISQINDVLRFDVIDTIKLSSDDFDSQFEDYLELADATRVRLIKRAHALNASLVEMHSHPGPWAAAFSRADRVGLAETVPHMFWRLAKRPYAAIVVAASGFDALVWTEANDAPLPLDALMAGSQILRPTNNSLKGWT